VLPVEDEAPILMMMAEMVTHETCDQRRSAPLLRVSYQKAELFRRLLG
jgi:hypothetical protein